jgi:hypothetical protein
MNTGAKVGIVILSIIGSLLLIGGIIWATVGHGVQNIQYHCDERQTQIQNTRAMLEGKQNSLGGMLDLNGDVAAMRAQFNLEVDRYNQECAGQTTNYSNN